MCEKYECECKRNSMGECGVASTAINYSHATGVMNTAVRHEVLKAMSVKSTVFWYVTTCNLVERTQSFERILHIRRGTAVAQWLRCCATNRKVAGSIPAGVIGFFINIKSCRSHYCPVVDLASNRNVYQEYFLGVKAAGA